ncbi:MAG: signal peptidase II [Planctomycetes bacterium]|nr:signal peptidase II [Planctomycetota bacterium]
MQPTHRMLLYILALTGLAVDQAGKYGVFAWLREAPSYRREVIPGAFDLVAQRKLDKDGKTVLHVNPGALFGLGQWGEGTANTIFAAISLVAAGVILFWSCLASTARDRRLCVALGLIFAGTLGNLYDRLFFGGVRDFLHWHYLVDWPVFNFADCCLVFGAGLLLLQAFQPQQSPEDAETATASVSSPPAHAEYLAVGQGK